MGVPCPFLLITFLMLYILYNILLLSDCGDKIIAIDKTVIIEIHQKKFSDDSRRIRDGYRKYWRPKCVPISFYYYTV